MKKSKKLLLATISVLTITAGALGLASCNGGGTSNSSQQTADSDFKRVYATYVEYTEAKGGTPLSYEAWLMTIRGEDGKDGETGPQGPQGEKGEDGETGPQGEKGEDGVGIEKVEYDNNGNLVITFTDGSTQIVEIAEKHNFGEWISSTQGEVSCENKIFYRICKDCNTMEWKHGSIADHTWATTYSYDHTFHWYECSNCSAVKDKVEHIDNGEGDCEICAQPFAATEGIIYALSNDGAYAEVIEYIGEATKVKIADTYQGVPVTSIRYEAFYDKSITSVIIPDSVTSIGYGAFSSCSNLTSVTIPDSVTSIGYGAFQYCSNLTSVTIPDGVTSIEERAFQYCSNLTSVTIPDGVTSIEERAFYDCSNLTNVTIPDGVTSIGERAFYDCDKLTNVTIPDGVTSIGYETFYNCSKLTLNEYDNGKYLGTKDNPYFALLEVKSKKLSSYTIHPDTKVIADEVFYECSYLTSIEIPDSVTSIGNEAFYECYDLTSVTIGDSVTSIGNSAFEYCDSLTSVVIGNSVTSIGSRTFDDCDNLTSVTIPDSVTSIGFSAFYNCGNLTSVYITDIAAWCTIWFGNSSSNPLYYAENLYVNNELITELVIPDGVTSISSYLFYNCNQFTSVTIGNSVTSIGECAFYSCSNLTSVTIGNSVTSIGERAFYDCSNLTSVYYNGTAEEWAKIMIDYYCNSDLTNATRYYYSASQPTEEGKYWHYDENGEVVIWTKEE